MLKEKIMNMKLFQTIFGLFLNGSFQRFVFVFIKFYLTILKILSSSTLEIFVNALDPDPILVPGSDPDP